MSEKELIEALRGLIDRHAPPAHESSLVAQEIIRRDSRRLQLLGAVSIFLWFVGIAGIILVFFWLNRYFMMTSWGTTEPQIVMEIFHTQRELHHSLEAAMACLAALMLGSVCTIWLIASSRRATLSQINLSLLRLSEQFEQLRQVPGETAPKR